MSRALRSLWVCAIGCALLLFASGCRKRAPEASPTTAPTSSDEPAPVRVLYPGAPGSFVKLVGRTHPAVVTLRGPGPVQGGPFDWIAAGSAAAMAPLGEQGERLRACLGSGVIIDAQGTVLTNAHLVEDLEALTARLWDGREVAAKVVGQDAQSDVAVLELDGAEGLKLSPARLGDSARLEVGEWLLAVGDPLGQGPTVSAGILMVRELDLPLGLGGGPRPLLRLDADISPAVSGGPVVNMVGEVVGISTALTPESRGLAIPIAHARRVAAVLKERGQVVRTWIGVYIDVVTPEVANRAGLDKPRGALVTSLVVGGPGQRAGLKVGDVILAFDGKVIAKAQELPALGALTPVGQPVPVTVWRDKQKTRLRITPEPLPE